ncbi:hypothetical protein VPH35_075272 [Triticum aestivum]
MVSHSKLWCVCMTCSCKTSPWILSFKIIYSCALMQQCIHFVTFNLMSRSFLFYFNASSFSHLAVANFLICICFISLYAPRIAHLAVETNLQATTQGRKKRCIAFSIVSSIFPFYHCRSYLV